MDGSIVFTRWHQCAPHLTPESIPKRHIDRFSRFCTAHGRFLYFTMGRPFPLKLWKVSAGRRLMNYAMLYIWNGSWSNINHFGYRVPPKLLKKIKYIDFWQFLRICLDFCLFLKFTAWASPNFGDLCRFLGLFENISNWKYFESITLKFWDFSWIFEYKYLLN